MPVRTFICFRRCSSRMCIFTSVNAVSVSVPSRFRSLVKVLPKILNSLSHDAEFAEMERTWTANLISGGSGWPGKQNVRSMVIGFGTRFYCVEIILNVSPKENIIGSGFTYIILCIVFLNSALEIQARKHSVFREVVCKITVKFTRDIVAGKYPLP